jgi:hypothetical protein
MKQAMTFMFLALMSVSACSNGDRHRSDAGPEPTDILGHWRWTASTGGMLDERHPADEKGATLDLRADGTFSFRYGEEPPIEGEYSVGTAQEPEGREVALLRLSREVPMFRPDDEFIILRSGDTLHLISPWTDSWSHEFTRSH